MYYFLAGTSLAEAFKNGKMLFRAKSLTDEGFALSITAEDIRGGAANALLGRYFHDSQFSVSMTDALWNLQYIALQVGSEVERSPEFTGLITERVVVGEGGTITPASAPQPWMGMGTVGWYKVDGSDEFVADAITFVDGVATVGTLTAGSEVCVRYNAKGNISQVVIPSDFIPAEVTLNMTMPLFAAASANADDIRSATKIAEVIVEVPRYQFDGNMDFSVTSSGAATSNISGMALAVMNSEGCEDRGHYAIIKEVSFVGNWYDQLVRMAVDGADKVMAVGDTATLAVYGQYADGSVGRIGNDNLTFASDSAHATVGASTGVVNAVSAGVANISITVTDKQSVDAFAKITVNA